MQSQQMPSPSSGLLSFPPFKIDLARSALTLNGDQRNLRRQSFDVLRYLVERSGRVVHSEEIIAAVWRTPPAYPDASLAQCIKDIRRALGDDGQWMIRTVSGTGYEFAAAVTMEEAEAAKETSGGQVSSSSDEPPPAAPPPPSTWLQRISDARLPVRLAAAAGLVLAALLFGRLIWAASTRPEPVLTMMAAPSLTFVPTSAGRRDAFSEMVAAELRRTPRGYDIEIKSPPSDAVAGGRRDPATRYAVTIAMREEASERQAVVQLIEAPTGRQVWAAAYTLASGSLEAQALMAARIAREIAVAVRGIEGRRPLPARLEAGHYALQGRLLLEGDRDATVNLQAMKLFDKGVEADAKHIQSLLGFARTRVASVANSWAPEQSHGELLKEAQTAVDRIIAVDRANVGGHMLRGVVARARGGHDKALASFELARSINPNYPLVHAEIGRTMLDLGQPDEALAQIARAMALSPADPVIWAWYYWSGQAAAQKGDFAAALEWLIRAGQANPRYGALRPWTAIAYAKVGQPRNARRLIDEHLAAAPKFSVKGWVKHFSRGRPPAAVDMIVPLGGVLEELGVPANPPAK